MQYCPKCEIQIQGRKTCCPLCQGELTGEPGEHIYPPMRRNRMSGVSFYRIIHFVFIALEIVFASIGLLTGFSGWITFGMVITLLVWLDFWLVFYFRNNFLKLFTIEVYLAMLICLFVDYRWTGLRWSFEWMIPSAFLGLTVFTAIIARVMHLKLEDYVIYVLWNALCCALQILPVLAGLNRTPYPAVIVTAGVLIYTAAILIFRTSSVKRASGKWLHL